MDDNQWMYRESWKSCKFGWRTTRWAREMFVALASPHCSLGTIDRLKGRVFPRGKTNITEKKPGSS